jgi:hypothetical protein
LKAAGYLSTFQKRARKGLNPLTPCHGRERSYRGFAMPYAVTAAFLVLLVTVGFGTAIFAGYEVAQLRSDGTSGEPTQQLRYLGQAAK